MKLESLSDFIAKTGSSLASLIKVALLSKSASSSSQEGKGKELVIMGNGPSLRQTIDNEYDCLMSRNLMAVNFAANSPDFFKLRPRYYILADSHFFNGRNEDPNVRRLWNNFSKVTWSMTLLVPTKFETFIKPLLMNTSGIEVRYFNLTPVEGFRFISHLLYGSGLGMPRPRNVLIPAIMEGIRLGYSKIYICGADHTWTKTLDVDKDNFVISVQPHFYKDNEEEHQRVRETYKGLKLHDVLGSMVVAFKSYWEISRYAQKKKVKIINATPGSMIDAFEKIPNFASEKVK